jgi:opacity protein-like surface antigen
MHRLGKATLVIVLSLIVAAPVLAQGRRYDRGVNELRVRAGLFELDGDSEYFDAKFLDFTGRTSDFEDVIAGVDFLRGLSDRWAVIFTASGFQGEEEQAYLAFKDEFGNDIVHLTTLDVGSLTAGLVFHLLPRNNRLVPYVGAGGGLYAWELSEVGDFIDFDSPNLEIFPARFQDDGNALGWYWMAGLRIGLTRTWSFFAESRWHNADDELGGELEDACVALPGAGDCILDLSGQEISGGLSVRF